MKPYYEDEAVQIFHGDCRDILPSIGKVDLVLTDPPYGMSYVSGWYVDKNPWGAIVGDDAYPVDLIPAWRDMARKAVFTFCRWDSLGQLPKPDSFIVWAKNNHSAGDLEHKYARKWEGICFYEGPQHHFSERPCDVYDTRRVPPQQLQHPTEKPVALCQWLIEPNTERDDVVFDPFMGSGTTIRAALNLHRKAIGIEIEERYCEIAANRCRQMVLL